MVIHLFKKYKDNIKNLDLLDIKLMHLAVIFLTFFVLLFIPQLMTWVSNSNKWLMLILAVVLFIRPCSRFWKK